MSRQIRYEDIALCTSSIWKGHKNRKSFFDDSETIAEWKDNVSSIQKEAKENKEGLGGGLVSVNGLFNWHTNSSS